MKKIITTLTIVSGLMAAMAQPAETLSLEQCYAMAKAQYPLARQKELIAKSKDYNLDNAKKGYLPQINFSAQATYQSDVTRVTLPAELPFPIQIEPPSKDQYKMYGEVNQSLTDAFFIEPQRKLVTNHAEVEQQQLEVELYKLKDRINQLYFGVLLIDGQLQQVDLLKKDIQTGLRKVSAAIDNGVAYKSNKSELQAESLKVEQHTIELQAMRKAYLKMLGEFIHQQLDDNTVLQTPITVAAADEINRPELRLFDSQKKTFDIQNKLLVAKTLPRAGVFFQGGYAKPGLNMLKNEFAGYYFLGVRLGWSLTGFYTLRTDKKLLDVNRSVVDLQRESFLFNTNFALTQQASEVQKLKDLITTDDEIIALRTDVKNAAQAQLENGVITANDYIVKANAEDEARQNRILHHLQLLMAEYNYNTTSGN